MHMNSFGHAIFGPNSFLPGFHLGGFMPLLFWGIVLFILFKVSQAIMSRNKTNSLDMERQDSAMSVLEKQYASGKIGREEFLQRKNDLQG
ncbi:MAG: hypothetical protein R6W66_11920 [Pelovirga sp.]